LKFVKTDLLSSTSIVHFKAFFTPQMNGLTIIMQLFWV